jgi:hypothetical protein
MFRYLTPKDGPVFEGLTNREVVYAKNQPEYLPLRALVSDDPSGRVTTRWMLTDDQRKAIAAGADIYLMLLTFHQPLQPIQIATGDGTEDIEWVERVLLDEWEPMTNTTEIGGGCVAAEMTRPT